MKPLLFRMLVYAYFEFTDPNPYIRGFITTPFTNIIWSDYITLISPQIESKHLIMVIFHMYFVYFIMCETVKVSIPAYLSALNKTVANYFTSMSRAIVCFIKLIHLVGTSKNKSNVPIVTYEHILVVLLPVLV